MKAFTVPTVFTAVDKFNPVVKNMANGLGAFSSKAQAGIDRANRMFKTLTPTLSETSKQLFSFATTAAIAAAIVGGIAFSTRSIKEYESATASLMAVTGLSREEFEPFKKEITSVAITTKESSISVAKAFEVIGSANSDLLKSSSAMGEVTKSAILLSHASGDELGVTAANLVGVMNQFSLGATEAGRASNVLAAGTKVGAATIPDVAESMKNFGSVAASANLSIEQSVALVEVLGTKSVFGAEAGTKLRGSLLKLQQAGVGYASGQFNINDALTEANAKIMKLHSAKERDAAITKMFGAENVSTGKIILSNIGLFEKWTKEVTGTSEASIQAAKKNDTLTISVEQLKNKWVTMITTNNKVGSGLIFTKKAVQFLTNNLEAVVTVVALLIGSLLVFKGIILLASGVMAIYSIAVGVSAAITGTLTKSIVTNNIAMGAYRVVMGVVTAAQWLWNAAMLANPIGLIIIAVVALIALVTIMIVKWREWGAAATVLFTLIFPPLGILIMMVQSFRRNWEMISEAFKNGGMIEGIKAIGKTILDAILMPLQQVVSLIADATGFEWAVDAEKKLATFRKELGVNVTKDESGNNLAGQTLNSKAASDGNMSKMISETIQKQQTEISIKDQTGRAQVSSNNDITPVKLSKTVG